MKNVLQLIGSFHQGGSERQAVQLTRLLCEDGRCNLFVATLDGEGILRPEIEKLGFADIAEFKLSSFYDANFVKQLRRLVRLLREEKIDVIHTHDFYTNVFGMLAAMLARVPLAVASKRETGGMRSTAQKFIEKLAFRRAGAIIVNSLAVQRYLVDEGVLEEKLKVVYNGLDLKRLTPSTDDRHEICELIGLPCDPNLRFVTLVANLRHDVKNQPMFLRVAARVAAEFPETHFVIAGEGALRGSLERLAVELGVSQNVHFIGLCTMVPELLSISFAGVLTSFNEGLSNSILEYMAAGKPVVATNVGGAVEAIVENQTGFLVDSDDDDAMAARLIGFLRNDGRARRFGERGRLVVEKQFSCAEQLNATLKLYGIE